ncbi:MAG: YihY/virulence factor BrkB family protein [Syntrophomonadaceae bacterium]|jgi:membrane protein
MIGRELYRRFYQDEVTALAAQLTYYLVLAFFPFLIFLLTLLSYTTIASEVLLNNLAWLLPANNYALVRGIINETVAVRSQGLLSFGMIIALWAASNGMNAVIRGINKAYNQEETRPFWQVRLISILATIFLALVFIFSLALLVFGQLLGEVLSTYLGVSLLFVQIWSVMRYVTSLGIMILVFALVYWLTPNRRLRFSQVLPGSICTTLGWIIISYGFSYYVNGFANYSIMYGSLGGIIIFLIWLYINSIMLLLGGEINAVLASKNQ